LHIDAISSALDVKTVFLRVALSGRSTAEHLKPVSPQISTV
jgi:hypothetical protein